MPSNYVILLLTDVDSVARQVTCHLHTLSRAWESINRLKAEFQTVVDEALRCLKTTLFGAIVA